MLVSFKIIQVLVLNCYFIVKTAFFQNINQPIAHMKLKINNSETNKVESHVVSCDLPKLKLLIQGKLNLSKIIDYLNYFMQKFF